MNDELKDEMKVMIINGSAFIGAYLLKKMSEKVLEKGFQKKVPKKPDDSEITWTEALAWAAFTGAMAGMLKLLIKRGTKTELDRLI